MRISKAIKLLLTLSFPIILGQLGQMLIGAGDVLIASKYSTNSVAAIGLANGVINPIFLFGIGLMMGISPSLARIRGEGKDTRQSLVTIIIYSFACSIVLTLLTLILNQTVPLLGFDAHIVPSIQSYIRIVAWSFPFAIVFQGIKEYLQAYEDVFIANAITIVAVIVNLIANYILVFGIGNFAGYGEIGLAIASFFTRVIQLAAILLYAINKEKRAAFDLAFTKVIAKFSFPIAFMFFIEVLAFCTVTILSGNISVLAAATNNIIMTIASIAFMIPLSIASAVAVKIGHAYGERDIHKVKTFAKAAVLSALSFSLFSISILLVLPDKLMGLISPDPAVIALGVQLLLIVAIFQLSDSFQVILTGVLRGLQQTKVTSVLVFIGYWVLGIPIGYYLSFHRDYGVHGLWIGLAISLSLVAIFLTMLTLLYFKKFTLKFSNSVHGENINTRQV